MPTKKKETKPTLIEVNTDPVHKFTYNQIFNHDFNFALLTKDNRVLHSPVMCKDYFEDIFYSEYNKKAGKIYGLDWKPGMLDIKPARFKLLISHTNGSLSKRAKLLEEFINQFDKAQKISKTKVFQTTDENSIIIDFSKKWTNSGPLLSVLTTLIRIAGCYKGGDAAKYLSSKMKNMPSYMRVEYDRLTNTKSKLLHLLDGYKIKFPWNSLSSVGTAHVMGIVMFNDFPQGGKETVEMEIEFEEGDE